MNGPSLADKFQGLIARGLGPTITIQICEQSTVATPMHMHCSAKSSLRKNALHLGTRPVLTPVLQKLFLPNTQQLKIGKIDRFRIILGIIDMIRAGAHLGNLPIRPALEFSILKNCKIHSTNSHACEINPDASVNGCGINRIR